MSEFEPRFKSLVDIYEHATTAFSGRPLFGTKSAGRWNWMTYGEFREKTDALRGALAKLGIGGEDVVAVISNNRPEWAIAAYATYGRAASFVPMYENQLPKDWAYILGDCKAKVLFVANPEIAAKVATIREGLPVEHVVVMEGMDEGASVPEGTLSMDALLQEEPVPLEKPKPEDIAGFIYTSGTTGKPKGVLLSHENLASNVSAIHEFFPMTPEDRSLSFLPWAHSFGQTCELHGLFSMGASMGIAEAVDKIVANLAEVKPTLLFSVPRIFNRIYDGLHKKMADEGGFKLAMFNAAVGNANYRAELAASRKRSGWADFKHGLFDKLVFSKVRDRFGGRLKYAFSGGAALSTDVAQFIDNLGIMVYEGYGLTETSPIATANSPSGRKIGSVGKPIPGIRVEIDREVTGDAKHGEIIVFGHNVMQGYYGLDEENAKVFVEGPDGERGFRTGDMGYVDGDGYVFISGRIKEQYKLLNGKYVVPTPLEEKLKLSRYITNVMVYGMNQNYNVAIVIPDLESLVPWAKERGLGSDVAALLENADVRQLFQDEIDQYSAEFKQYEKVRKFALGATDFTPENGMLTPTLKLKRRIVLEHYQATIDALYQD